MNLLKRVDNCIKEIYFGTHLLYKALYAHSFIFYIKPFLNPRKITEIRERERDKETEKEVYLKREKEKREGDRQREREKERGAERVSETERKREVFVVIFKFM